MPGNKIDLSLNKKLFFKGEKLFYYHDIKQLTYSEIINTYKKNFLLLCPITIYELPKRKVEKKNYFFKTIKEHTYTNFKHKDTIIIKNNISVNIAKTSLVISNNNQNSNNFYREISFNKIKKNNFLFNYNICENIFNKTSLSKYFTNVSSNISFFIKYNQFFEPYSVIGNIEFLPNYIGKIESIKEIKPRKFRRILISLTQNSKKVFTENKTKLYKKIIGKGNFITNNLSILNSGIIKQISTNKLEFNLAKSFLFSYGGEIFWDNRNLIKKNENLGILLYKKTKSVDIIQGLPKVEEILEARKPKKSDILTKKSTLLIEQESNIISLNRIYPYTNIMENFEDSSVNFESFINTTKSIGFNIRNPHVRLQFIINFYKNFLNYYKATYKSLRKIQSCLLNSIQSVYFSQGVTISDKHIEVIIKQMTSKVKIKDIGKSGILRNEYINLQQVYNINKILKKTKTKEMTYEPVLLGITKASLTNQSFISAASFQETVRILTLASIQGKIDWLRGLKENVIIGRLIPAGTGFKRPTNLSFSTK